MLGHALIDDLLAGRWRDPETGEKPRIPIAAIVIEPSLDSCEAELIAPLRLGSRLAVVSDPRTRDALRRRVQRALEKIARVDHIVLEDARPDLATAAQLIERSRAADA